MTQPVNPAWPKAFCGSHPSVNIFWMRAVGLDRYYVAGYKKAGDILLEKAGADTELLFPLVFAYRQYIEIQLKLLINCMKWLSVAPVVNQSTRTHDLKKLWELTRSGLESKWGKDTTGELDEAQSVILDFHTADPTGEEFRYGTFSTKTKPKIVKTSLESLPDTFSISGVGEAINKLHKLLSQCCAELEAEISEMAEQDFDKAMDRIEAERGESESKTAS